MIPGKFLRNIEYFFFFKILDKGNYALVCFHYILLEIGDGADSKSISEGENISIIEVGCFIGLIVRIDFSLDVGDN